MDRSMQKPKIRKQLRNVSIRRKSQLWRRGPAATAAFVVAPSQTVLYSYIYTHSIPLLISCRKSRTMPHSFASIRHRARNDSALVHLVRRFFVGMHWEYTYIHKWQTRQLCINSRVQYWKHIIVKSDIPVQWMAWKAKASERVERARRGSRETVIKVEIYTHRATRAVAMECRWCGPSP